jgi:hypothetical protein
MAEEIVGIKIQVGGQEKILSSMGEIRKELKQAQFDVLKFSEAFGASSKEAVDAAKKVAQLKDAIGDAKDLVGAFNPDAKFRALSGAVQGVAGGFAALQGAMGLIGVKGEEVEKTLLKVQSALAISEGLNSVMASIDAFKNLGAVIQSTTVFQKANAVANTITAATMKALGISAEVTSVSFKVLKTAIVSTGIGVLVIALGEAVSAFQNFQNSADKAAEAQKNLNEKISESAKGALKVELDFLNSQEKIDVARAKARGASEKEIFDIEQGFRRQRGEAQVRFYNEVKTADKKAADETRGEVAKINAEGQAAQLNFDAKVAADRKQKTKERKEKEKQEAKERADKERQDAKERADAELEAVKQIAQLKGEAEVLAINDEFEAKRKAIENTLAAEIKDVEANEKLKAETKTALIKALNDKANAEIRVAVKEQLDQQAEDSKESLKKYLEEERSLRAGEIQGRIDQIDLENQLIENDFEQDLERLAEKRVLLEQAEANELSNTELTEFQKFEIKKKYTDQKNALTKSEVDIEKASTAAKIENAQKISQLLSSLSDVFGKQTAAGKAFAIASATIDTYLAAQKAYQSMVGIPVVGPALAAVAAGVAVVGGIKNVQSILAVKVPGGAGGSSSPSISTPNLSAPIVPAAPIQNTVTQLNQSSINQLGSATSRAYVVESDVTNSQERITRINRAARLT